jgi:dTDP-glucose 4,6-dehydratase
MGQALRGEDLTVFGDGSQTRSFCYVDDLIEGIYRLLFSDYTLPVNLGSSEEVTIMTFAKEIIALSSSPRKIKHQPLPQGDPLQRQPDLSLAKKTLNWAPKVNRTEGMKKTLEYFKTFPKSKLFKVDHKDFSKHIKF